MDAFKHGYITVILNITHPTEDRITAIFEKNNIVYQKLLKKSASILELYEIAPTEKEWRELEIRLNSKIKEQK